MRASAACTSRTSASSSSTRLNTPARFCSAARRAWSQEKLEAVVALLLREHNAKARIITTPWDDISGETILAAMQDDHSLAEDMLATVMAEHHDDDDDDDDDDDECCHHHHDHDEHDECCHHHHDHDEA